MCIVWLLLLFSEPVGVYCVAVTAVLCGCWCVSCGCYCCSLRLLVCIVWLSLLIFEAVCVYHVAVTADL